MKLYDSGSKYHLSDGSQEMMNWKTCMRTHLVEGDAELLDSASSVSLADAGGKDSTITSTSRNFDELPYWEFRYIRDIIRSLDLVLEDFILDVNRVRVEAWAKWTILIKRKEWLAEEVYREIAGWTSMEELMVDEVVDKDMSTHRGKWTDFNFEAFEEGVDIEKRILSSLMDELIHDLM
ncbi:hypothetical protein K7X08_022113 [Anisodus acutangulus]|uniref:DUF4378 domain-containing protein n=1 Tax=Anisodus acutangulus TaxID=402998 RepID=A0A9Q1QX45_9SOLA|nr:hypothetical protein K7X08_022113 [Anisodus acutangulus]